MSLLVKALAAEPGNLVQSLGSTAQPPEGKYLATWSPNASQALSALTLAVSPWWPGGDCHDFPAYLHVPFSFPAQASLEGEP